MVNVIVSSAGTSGPRGNSVLSGTGTPSSGTGIDGDYYVDDTHYPTSVVLYGPRASGTWPGSGLTLAGAAGALLAANNLSDLLSAATARTNLGLGGAATLNVGTASSTVAAGNDTRIVGAAQTANNLADLANEATARTNLGLGGAAVLSVGTTTGTVAAGDDSRVTGAAQKSANLSDLGSAATARTNLAVPPSARQIIAGTGLTGGGDLTADRTLTVTYGTSAGSAVQGNDSRIVGAAQVAGDIGGTAGSPQVTGTHLASPLPIAQGGTASASRTWAGLLTPTGVKTANYTATPGDFIPVDATSGNIVITLPTAPADLTTIAIKQINTASAHTTAVNTGGADVYNRAGGGTSLTLTLLSQGVVLQYSATPAIWYVYADDLPLTQLDARYVQTTGLPLPIASGGTGQATQQAALNAIAGATTSGSYLRGTGSNVSMSAIQSADLPAATTSVQGAVVLDGTAADIQPLGVRAAGAIGKSADAGHVHVMPTLDQVSAPVANVGMNSHKLTSLANGSSAADALAFGQLPPVTIVAAATGTYATDVANIGTAVTAAGTNGVVYFPYGTYNADGLAPLSGQTWYGPATIQRPSSSTASIITATGITGFILRQLVIDGNSASSASSNAAVYLINTTATQIVGVTVQNTPATNAAIILRGSVRGLVDACQITNVGYGILIGLNHLDAYSCYANVIRGCQIDTTVADAIFLSENLGSTTSISVTGSVIGTVVTGCTVRNFGDCGIEIGSGTLHTEVSGCAFIGISNGSGNNGVLFRDAMHANVTGCTVSNLTKTGSTGVYMVNLNGSNQHNSVNNVDCYNVGYGYIVVGGISGGSVGTAAQDISFNGGIIDTTAIDGIHLNNVAGFSITGTQVHSAGQQGISVGKFSTSSATDGTITGARVFNSSQLTTGDSGIIIFQSSADIVITGCRIGDNQGGSKTQAYGIRLFDTTITNVTISNCDLTNGGTTSNFTSAPAAGSGIQLLNCPGSTPSALPNVVTQPGASVEPSDYGLIAWSYDAGLASQSSTTVSGGTLYLTAVYPRAAFNSTKVYFSVATVGVTPTAGDNWIGLYNTSGTLLASKGIDSNVTAGVGLQTITWTSATGAQPAGQYWIGFYFNAGTEPTLYRAPTPADNATQNIGLTTTNYRMCQQAGGFTTALPSPLTVSSNSISGSPRLFWVALG